ncbi:hypothetical protein FRB90_001187 [Tulasnella sp. 427]|nr:hypothetical protein FRB90_001187 [Tulasnella sp. 427]
MSTPNLIQGQNRPEEVFKSRRILNPLNTVGTSGWDSDSALARSPTARKYGSRAGSPASSMNSGSPLPGLIEHFTSSDSSVNPRYVPGLNESIEPDNPVKFNFREKLRLMSAKRKAKQYLTILVDSTTYETKREELNRRHDAAERLLEIARRNVDGEDIVARRFIKKPAKQLRGVSALFKLSDLECLYQGQEAVFKDKSQAVSSRLLKLVVSHSKDSSFFRSTLPAVLRSGTDGLPAMIFLARSMPDLFTRTDPNVLSSYLQRVTEAVPPWSDQWLRGVLLTNLWVLSQISHGEHYEGILRARITTTEFVMHKVLRACLPPCIDPAIGSFPRGWMMAFQVIISACILATKEDILNSILPPRMTLQSFVELCVKLVVSARIPEPTPHQIAGCGLGLKALATLRSAPDFPRLIPANDSIQFEDICMTVVLDRTLWMREIIGAQDLARWNKLRPEEDAFDVLCKLQKPAFQRALASALQRRETDTIAADQLLDPLLWLSNMPEHIVVAHEALVQGGSCDFLANIIHRPLPQATPIENRFIWRAKGLAMTCLGNIIERMAHKELKNHIKRETIEAVVAIKGSCETPLVQRGQAIFMLQRYTIAADRTGVECHHREETQTFEDASVTSSPLE